MENEICMLLIVISFFLVCFWRACKIMRKVKKNVPIKNVHNSLNKYS